MPAMDPKHEPYPNRELLPEEREAGSDDPQAQSRAIREDAAERAALTRDSDGIERRRSEDTVDVSVPGEPGGA